MRITRARLVLSTTAVFALIGIVGLGAPAVSALVDGPPGARTVRSLAGDTHRLCGDVAFQEANGLAVDGRVGPETAAALNSALAGD